MKKNKNTNLNSSGAKKVLKNVKNKGWKIKKIVLYLNGYTFKKYFLDLYTV